MGIFGALQSAVSGLKAQSHAMENISGNIANSQTIGYKRIDTSFVDLLADAPVKQQVAGAVSAFSRSMNTLRGDIQNADTQTYMALNGNGFFVTEKADGSPGTFYTRRGDFDIDRNGFLVNGAGYRLTGLDMENGVVTGSVAKPIQIDNSFLKASASKKINYQLNLPKVPKTSDYDGSDPATALLKPASFADAPTAGVGPDFIAGGTESAAFTGQSISGGGLTLYTATGEPVNVQMRWAKTDNTAGAEKWELYYASDSAPAAPAAWTKLAIYAYDQGELTTVTSAAGGAPVPVGTSLTHNISVNNTALGAVLFDHGLKGMTQFADNSGMATTTTLKQDGYGAGEFISVGISDDGRVVASYTNGETREVSQIVTASFSNANALRRGDGGAYTASTESGEPIIDQSGQGIVGSSTEASNTDISEEFTKLIVTQQAYSANTKIVTAADEMLREALSMIR
ncbi:flagellar hook-basal body complex protein [Devosia sp. SD17-2]|uniref:flagellar hook protein FlgE n=1 Tax=Devosia sp. SD17-2 TaxID=2976459 RepID=UPI0023D88D7A|nr:flagellar hook-basal body complex protein [Devosia sp. SD17-2]WEJ34818.1 flagellar hook-basal body complex protein [Devosia sp. SD17-2]